MTATCIIDRLLDGAGVPAGQMVGEGMGGYNPDLKPDAYDVEGAKKLLAEAGLPNGFGLTIHSSNDRFPGDGDVAQATGPDVRPRRIEGERRLDPAVQRLCAGRDQA